MNQKLLLIDNNTADIEKINSILSTEFPNINIYSTNNQNDILKETEILSPDIIIFDIDYPEDNIDQNLKLLLDILRIKQLPIIVLSSSTDYNKIFKAGAINLIQKPYSEITLISNLKTAREIRQRQGLHTWE